MSNTRTRDVSQGKTGQEQEQGKWYCKVKVNAMLLILNEFIMAEIGGWKCTKV